MMRDGEPVDLAQLTPDQLFEMLGASDMCDRERLAFLHHMHAWSHAVLPGPNHWWIHAFLVIRNWRDQTSWHVDQLIQSALGPQPEGSTDE